MDIKSRILCRAKPKPVEFLSKFQTVTFDSNGVGTLILDPTMVIPIEAALLVPVGTEPMYNETLGVACTVDAKGRMTIAAEDFAEFLTLGNCCDTALVSVGMRYNARSVQQLLPNEVRKLTNGSAEVMQLLTDKDPGMTDRLTDSITQKIGAGDKNFDMNSAITSALNIEITLKHPELLEEIEIVQQMQPATQLAIMIGADEEFVRTVYRYVPEGSMMISELLSIIDPPPPPPPVAEDDEEEELNYTIEIEGEPILSELDAALLEDIEYDDEQEEGAPMDDGVHGDYQGDDIDSPMLSLA